MKKLIFNILGILGVGMGSLFFIASAVPVVEKGDSFKPIELPKILHEISGLTDYGSTTIACVQDELGVIFIYDFLKNEIINKIQFAEDGDFEGVTKVGDILYVLRSDGVLFKVAESDKGKLEVHKIETNIPAKNNEALCYDELNNRLLIGSKVKAGKGSNKDERIIYSFNLKTEKIERSPAYVLKKKDVIEYAEKNKIQLPYERNKKTGKKSIQLKLGVSGISIHPKTNELYVLCAVDFLLLRYSKNGSLIAIHKLNKELFPQAEGITFYQNGDLFISNEGVDGKPTLLKYDN